MFPENIYRLYRIARPEDSIEIMSINGDSDYLAGEIKVK